MTKESQLPGTLMPAHPDLFPIVWKMRKKYNPPEINPYDLPVEEIGLRIKLSCKRNSIRK
jgi:hypothetical protein